MILDLEENEVVSIIQVLDNLPTQSNAWPLVQKLKRIYEAEKSDKEEIQEQFLNLTK